MIPACNKGTVLLLHRQNRQPPLCNEIRTSKEMPKEMDEHVCPTIPIASFKISITKEPSLCYTNPQTYWRVLKNRLKKEGNETVTNCNAFKLRAADGKMRLTDVADTEQLFRLIQSIPSPKAEPFKQWMALVTSQRIDQMQDPELSIDQAIIDYKRLGF